jgi:hypothetical protein
MPYDVMLNQLVSGYLAESVVTGEQGGQGSVVTSEFISSEDGDAFIERLEGFPTELLWLLSSERRVRPSMVDHLVAVIRRDRSATIYVNELNLVLGVRSKGKMEAGRGVSFGEITEIQRLSFVDQQAGQVLTIPRDAGFICLFSLGWRKGLFFDFTPLLGSDRPYDLEEQCGRCFAHLNFQHILKITEETWRAFFERQWFPFIMLQATTIRSMMEFAHNQYGIDALTTTIAQEVAVQLQTRLAAWETSCFFNPHLPLLRQAVERHLAGDYISAVSILYPRIEGLMREYHRSVSAKSPSQNNLAESITSSPATPEQYLNLYLPKHFERFLTDVYFPHFDPGDPRVVSRNTVAHGVAPSDQFTLKSSLIGLLIVDQIFHFTQYGRRTFPEGREG